MAWIAFSYSLPSKARSSPRVALWRRLRRLGAIAPKAGVYVLPGRDDCLEAFQWLAQEVEQAGGEAVVLRVERFDGLTDAELVGLFRRARKGDYDAIEAEAIRLEKASRKSGDRPRLRGELGRLQRAQAALGRMDFFDSPEGARVGARLARIEQALSDSRPLAVGRASREDLRRRRWVTRPRPHVDRLACAWLIRRFINRKAVIRYADAARPGEVAFDMPGAPFGHRGNLCTFQTMAAALGLDDAGVAAIAEIVHEIDLRDGRYSRPETEGVDAVLRGWLAGGLSDGELEAHGIALFEGLYAALSRRRRT